MRGLVVWSLRAERRVVAMTVLGTTALAGHGRGVVLWWCTSFPLDAGG